MIETLEWTVNAYNLAFAATLLTAAVALAGILGFLSLPVSPLPQVEFPTISVSAGLPGAMIIGGPPG